MCAPAFSEVKLNRMGQAVQTGRRGGRAHPAQLMLSPKKCLELSLKVELGLRFLACTSCKAEVIGAHWPSWKLTDWFSVAKLYTDCFCFQ